MSLPLQGSTYEDFKEYIEFSKVVNKIIDSTLEKNQKMEKAIKGFGEFLNELQKPRKPNHPFKLTEPF